MDTPENNATVTVETLDPEAKAQYLAVKAGFDTDPASVPEKFKNTEDPALEYIKSYQSLATMTDLERAFHEQNQSKEQEQEETPPEKQEEVPKTLDFEAKTEDFGGLTSLNDAYAAIASSEGEPPLHAVEYLKEKHGMSDADIQSTIVPTVKRIAESEKRAALDVIGGAENYKKLFDWVSSNKTAEQVAAINETVRNPALRESVLRGLMAEAGISLTNRPRTEVNPQANVPGTDGVVGYSSQAELNKDLTRPEIQDNFHPDHAKVSAEIQAKIAATRPNILM